MYMTVHIETKGFKKMRRCGSSDVEDRNTSKKCQRKKVEDRSINETLPMVAKKSQAFCAANGADSWCSAWCA
jgi:hypothetical protein